MLYDGYGMADTFTEVKRILRGAGGMAVNDEHVARDMRICLDSLDGLPSVGVFHVDGRGYGICDEASFDDVNEAGFEEAVARPDGRAALNVEEYRVATVHVKVNPDGSYRWPDSVRRLQREIRRINYEGDDNWQEMCDRSFALWERLFGKTERHTWEA